MTRRANLFKDRPAPASIADGGQPTQPLRGESFAVAVFLIPEQLRHFGLGLPGTVPEQVPPLLQIEVELAQPYPARFDCFDEGRMVGTPLEQKIEDSRPRGWS